LPKFEIIKDNCDRRSTYFVSFYWHTNSCVGRKVYISPIPVNFFYFSQYVTFAVGNSKHDGYIPCPSCDDSLLDLKMAVLWWYTHIAYVSFSLARTGFCCPSTFRRYSLKLAYVACHIRALLTEVLKMEAALFSQMSAHAENITQKTVI
jgi:hypothetical protein